MALIYKKPYLFGVEMNYWTIGKQDFDWDGKSGSVTIFAYRSKEAKDDLNEPGVMQETFTWSGEDFTFTKDGNIFEEAYNKIKEPILDEERNNTNEFSTAEDDPDRIAEQSN